MTRSMRTILALALVFAVSAARAEETKPSESLYQVPMHLVDQAGAKVALDAYRGHPVVVSMFYGSCPAACPLLVEAIHKLEKQLSKEQLADVRVLLVSFDAERDTPAQLKKMGTERHVDFARWKMAAAPDDEARELAALLGIKYRKLPDGAFDHTSVIALLDREGNLRGRWEGLQLADETVTKVKELAHR